MIFIIGSSTYPPTQLAIDLIKEFNNYWGIADKETFISKFLFPKCMAELGMTEDEFKVTPEAVKLLVKDYVNTFQVRRYMKGSVEHICRKAAVKRRFFN